MYHDTIWFANRTNGLFYGELKTKDGRQFPIAPLSVKNDSNKRMHLFPELFMKEIEEGSICMSGKRDSHSQFENLDTAIIASVKLLSYYGAQVQFMNDSLLVIPLLFQPKGPELSQEWLNNAGNFGRFAILNINDCTAFLPLYFKPPLKFNPLLEHPLIGSNNRMVYYTQVHEKNIWEWDVQRRTTRKIKVKGSEIEIDDFDLRKISDREYGLDHYQASQFATGLWLDSEEGVLIRRIKKSQKSHDENGLMIPPYWADMIFEIIDIHSGRIIKKIRIEGRKYDNRQCFVFNGMIYIKDEEDQRKGILAFDGFRYNHSL